MERVELSCEENISMIIRAQNGDIEAQNFLIENNIGLVRSVIKRFLNRGCEYEDLMQIGCIGLLKAVQKFDASFNVKLSTYAIPMIIGEIKRFLRDDGIIKVSRNLKEIAYKANTMKDLMEKNYGREPTICELAIALDIPTEDLVMALDSHNCTQYLYDTIHQDDGTPVLLIDKIDSNENQDLETIDKIALKQVLQALEPRERQIIILRYFKDKTQSEIAHMLGISQVQVSRIEKRILNKLKEGLV